MTIAHQTRTETKINSGSETDVNSNIILVLSRGGDPPKPINNTTVGQFRLLTGFSTGSVFLQFYLHGDTQNERKFRRQQSGAKTETCRIGEEFLSVQDLTYAV